jgi:hypothetical protein
MKVSGFLVAAAALAASGAAHASVIFDTISGVSQFNTNIVQFTNGGSPLGDSFAVNGVGHINSVSLSLGATNTADGGSVLIYIVPDAAGLPSHSGSTTNLTGATLLATVLDSSLTQVSGFNPALSTVKITPTPFAVTSGTYWIELVDGSDTNNGGTSTAATSALWGYNIDGSGVGTTNQFYSFNGGGTLNATSDAFGPYRMSVDATLSTAVPEPSTLAILGVSVIGLGIARRKARQTLG